MNEQLGFSSKKYLQINRFQAVIREIHSNTCISIAQVAYQFGYADQAHFSHEFKLMTGLSPKKYLNLLGKQEYFELQDDNYYSTGMMGYNMQ